MARASTINAPRGGKAADRSTIAVGYLRRSTDRQEQSIPDQKRACEHYAEEHGLRVLRFYVDDAISGTNTIGRQAFQDLIRDATSSGGGGGGGGSASSWSTTSSVSDASTTMRPGTTATCCVNTASRWSTSARASRVMAPMTCSGPSSSGRRAKRARISPRWPSEDC